MQQQKERSRAATTLDTEDWVNIYESKATCTEICGLRIAEGPDQGDRRTAKINAKGKESFSWCSDTTLFYA